MSALPKATKGVRIIILTAIVLGVIFVAFKVSYTDVPPERLAVTELVALANSARVPIGETFADRGTLEGAIDDLLPPAEADQPNSKGPFLWTLDEDGTLTGRSDRWNVEVVLRTADQGATWTCAVTPVEHAPRAGLCAVAR